MVKKTTKKTTKKQNQISKKETTKEKSPIEKGMEDIPPEARKKLEKIKEHLEKFKDKVIERFEDNILGVALLPPNEEKKEDINVLVLTDDSDSTKMSKAELSEKVGKLMTDMGKEIHKDLVVHNMLLTELWDQCYDGKHEGLQMIAMSAPVYDKGMLAAIKIGEIHKTMVLKKFEKYIVSYVMGGSLTQGRATPDSDIDVFVVIDDTDVKKMTRVELLNKLRAIIIGMGGEAGQMTGITNKLNIQVWLLTDYWDSIKDAHPVMFTFLRDGVPFYDRGMFMPWKQLLQMGRIKPSPEAIEMFLHSGTQFIDRINYKLRDIVMEDLFYAVLNPSQAALMMYGIAPTTPRETYKVMREILVKKEKLIEEKFVKTLETVVTIHKQIEYGKKNIISGTEIDELVKEAQEYLKRLEQLFKDIEERKLKKDTLETYENVVTIVRDVLKLEGKEKIDEKDVEHEFNELIIKKGIVPQNFLRLLNDVFKAKKDFDDEKITKTEVFELKKNSKELITGLIELIQRKRGQELEKTKFKIKYGKKFAEIILLNDVAFIINDLDSENKEISKAQITNLGSLSNLKKSSLEELEDALVNSKLPKHTFIKNAIFEDLKKLFGKDVEILINN
ncbi:MAG: nucleotidyltransferase domain-containing protein [Candidatus Woesearchaeota archaeon]